MTRARLSLAVVAATTALVALAPLGAGAGEAGQPPLLGLSYPRGTFQAVALRRYDRSAVRVVGAPLRLPAPAWAWARSPDGRRLVLGERGLWLVDPVRWRRGAQVDLGKDTVLAVSWPRADRIVAAAVSDGLVRIVAVDPGRALVVGSVGVRGRLVRSARTTDGLVLLLAPADDIGVARLVVVGADPRPRVVVLPEIRAGLRIMDGDGRPTASPQRLPGLAVDPDRGVAYVVGDDEPVAVVDLRRLTVTSRALPARATAAVAKASEGPDVSATWLGEGRIALAGVRLVGAGARQEPLGLRLLDVRDWSLRLVDAQVDHVVRSGPFLVWAAPAAGVRWYGLDGATLGAWSPPRGIQTLGGVYPLDHRVLVSPLGARRSTVVDLRRGQAIGKRPFAPPLFLVGS